jgi:hypothetical protein
MQSDHGIGLTEHAGNLAQSQERPPGCVETAKGTTAHQTWGEVCVCVCVCVWGGKRKGSHNEQCANLAHAHAVLAV